MPFLIFSDNSLQDAYIIFQKVLIFLRYPTKHAQAWFAVQSSHFMKQNQVGIQIMFLKMNLTGTATSVGTFSLKMSYALQT